jgi:hypothetical protein
MKVLLVFSSRTTGWKSARLHGGVMLQLLSILLLDGVRFLQLPLPGIPAAHLAMTPASVRRDDGFNTFRSDDANELVPATHTGSRCIRVPQVSGGATDCIAFWLEPVSIFGSLGFDGAFKQFTFVGRIVQPDPPTTA